MVEIRQATQKDLPQLARLVRREFEYQVTIDPCFQLNPEADWKEYVSARLRRSNAEILVAEKDGALVGYIDVRVIQHGLNGTGGRLKAALRKVVRPLRKGTGSIVQPRRFGFTEDIYVDPSVRGQLVATKLKESSFRWFKKRNVGEIEGLIAIGNEASRNLNRKLGFETVRVLVRKRL